MLTSTEVMMGHATSVGVSRDKWSDLSAACIKVPIDQTIYLVFDQAKGIMEQHAGMLQALCAMQERNRR